MRKQAGKDKSKIHKQWGKITLHFTTHTPFIGKHLSDYNKKC